MSGSSKTEGPLCRSCTHFRSLRISLSVRVFSESLFGGCKLQCRGCCSISRLLLYRDSGNWSIRSIHTRLFATARRHNRAESRTKPPRGVPIMKCLLEVLTKETKWNGTARSKVQPLRSTLVLPIQYLSMPS